MYRYMVSMFLMPSFPWELTPWGGHDRKLSRLPNLISLYHAPSPSHIPGSYFQYLPLFPLAGCQLSSPHSFSFHVAPVYFLFQHIFMHPPHMTNPLQGSSFNLFSVTIPHVFSSLWHPTSVYFNITYHKHSSENWNIHYYV